LFITLGTSLVVYPAAQLPIYALRNGAKLVIVNKGETPLDRYATFKFDIDLTEFSNKVLETLNTFLN
jgi:NAD-dependent deacetylase